MKKEFTYYYGKEKKQFLLEEKNFLLEMTQNEIVSDITGAEAVRDALKTPVGTPCLKELVHPGEKIVIITSDITRPCPSCIILPLVLEELEAGGVADKDITVVFALGSHRKHTEAEQRYLVGDEVFRRVHCVDCDISNPVHIGITAAGTPVDIDPLVASAHRRICVGNIEYHYFAGYSGGAKAIMPGVSTRAAIQNNHSMMVMENAKAGNLDANPVRQDIEEAAEMVSVDFIVNVVLDDEKHIIKAVAGDLVKAHREGCRFLDELYKIQIPQKADIVITTPGGFPKDINLYQAQKALDNAKHAVREGGIIILIAACKEGLGEKVFEKWMMNSPTPKYMIQEIQRQFQLGGHKAAAIGLIMQKNRIFLVSDMEDSLVKRMFFEPYPSVESALQEAFSQLGEDASVIYMPHGGSTLPCSR